MISMPLKDNSFFLKVNICISLCHPKDDFSPATANEERMIALRDE
jgi:hypothetical protein